MKYRPPEISGATSYSTSDEVKRWIPSLFVAAAGYYLVSTLGEFTFVDNFDLIIHEAGHLLLSFMGETICFLGGTLMQIIVPVLLIIFCAHNSFQKSLQFSLVLLGQNLINISVYIGDARAEKLHLFGPKGAIHDWHFLLTKYNLLEMDNDLSMVVIMCAVVVFMIGIIVPAFVRK